jgi:hypothetical protein
MNIVLVICSVAAFAIGANANGAGAVENSREGQRPLQQEASIDVSPILEQLDADGNRVISKDEAVQLDGLVEVFEAVDSDKDGQLSAAELSKFLAPTNAPVRTQ